MFTYKEIHRVNARDQEKRSRRIYNLIRSQDIGKSSSGKIQVTPGSFEFTVRLGLGHLGMKKLSMGNKPFFLQPAGLKQMLIQGIFHLSLYKRRVAH